MASACGSVVCWLCKEHRLLTNGDEYARGDSSHELDADTAEWDGANSYVSYMRDSMRTSRAQATLVALSRFSVLAEPHLVLHGFRCTNFGKWY